VDGLPDQPWCAIDNPRVPAGRPASTPATPPASPEGDEGGSHLCALNYCRRYRPAARTAQAVATSTSHLSFRCMVRPQGSGGEGWAIALPGADWEEHDEQAVWEAIDD
jgi:hypothetical protein